jgi:hypothetical protein
LRRFFLFSLFLVGTCFCRSSEFILDRAVCRGQSPQSHHGDGGRTCERLSSLTTEQVVQSDSGFPSGLCCAYRYAMQQVVLIMYGDCVQEMCKLIPEKRQASKVCYCISYDVAIKTQP